MISKQEYAPKYIHLVVIGMHALRKEPFSSEAEVCSICTSTNHLASFFSPGMAVTQFALSVEDE